MEKPNITTIFFDLDGTLLPFDEKEFFDGYLSLFSRKCLSYGIDEMKGVDALLKGFKMMLLNDGKVSNEKVFWNCFFDQLGYQDESLYSFLIDFYTKEFRELQSISKMNPLASSVISELKRKGYTLVLATNPVFPRIGTVERLRWAALDESDFTMITTYEEFSYTKPHLGYYEVLCEKMGVTPKEVLMIGNDVLEDGAIAQLGAQFILVDDCLINTQNKDISTYSRYSLSQLYQYCKALPHVLT
jgi:HAD superfamily hydrolase (TIGR01549 family)